MPLNSDSPHPLAAAPGIRPDVSRRNALLLVDTAAIGAEVQTAIDLLHRRYHCSVVASRAQLAEQLQQAAWPDVFVARAWPIGDAKLLASLAAEHAATRFTQVLGPWCEGEERTGQAVAGFERVFWDTLVEDLRSAAPVVGPASMESESSYGVDASGVVVVASRQYETVIAVDDAIQPYGAHTVALADWQSQRPIAAIWEGAQLSGREAASLASLAARLPNGVPLVALLDFPRAESVAAARELGATAVLRKPYDADRLIAALCRNGRLGCTGIRAESATSPLVA